MSAFLPWRPFRELARWDRDFDRRLREAFEEWWPAKGFPAVESFVRDGKLVVRADLPGIDPKEVEVSVLGNVLTIKGERKEKKEVKEPDYIRREVSYGSFERRLTLPSGVTADKIEAQYKDGVLEIIMPAGKEIEAKKVTVKVATEKK